MSATISPNDFLGMENLQEPLRILAVDDETTNNDLLRQILTSDGLEVHFAESGFSALEQVASTSFDLILLDIMMPGMDGFEVCRRLKADAATAEIPVIFLTALSDLVTRIEAFEAGGIDYITKPYSELEVLVRVRAQLRNVAAQRQTRRHSEYLEDLVAERTQLLLHADRLVTVGSMSAKMIHEINNPLTTVVGQYAVMGAVWQKLEGMMAKHLGGAEREQFESLTALLRETSEDGRNAAVRISDIVEGLRRFVRRPAERTAFGKGLMHVYSLRDIVDRSFRLIRPKARNDVRLHLDIDPELTLKCDRQLMEQVFVNLLGNSADAAAGTMIDVRVKAYQDHENLVVVYGDSGPGIAKELRPHVFEPFFTTKGEYEGTGLGLMICREILSLHHAQIELISSDHDQLLSGACFEIRFSSVALPATMTPNLIGG